MSATAAHPSGETGMASATGQFRGTAVLLSITLVAVLAGCAPAVHPAPSATSPATTHPTPTVEPQSATPTPLLGGDCSRLISIADVRSATATPSVALAPAQPLNQVYLIPLPQAGGLECDWRGSSPATDLDVAVLPNARAALDAQTARLDGGDDGKNAAHIANVPSYGDQSWTHCVSLGEDPSYGCLFDIRVGTFWIEVNQVYGGMFTPYPQAPGVHTLLAHLVDTVRSLPSVRAWKPDVRGLTLPTTCDSTLPLATVRSETGIADLTQYANAVTFNPLLDAAFVTSGSLYCQWFTQQDLPVFTLTMIPGSTWAWSGSAGPPAAASVIPLTTQAGLGTAAFGGCATSNSADGCDLFVLANHTWFQLKQGSLTGRPAALSTLESLARTFLTAIHYDS